MNEENQYRSCSKNTHTSMKILYQIILPGEIDQFSKFFLNSLTEKGELQFPKADLNNG